ncbi:MAG: SMC family ATPase [Gemmatimonadaceae bacterium]|nr:SMC family ATPase [Gemmatimonadaceae bacterium]
MKLNAIRLQNFRQHADTRVAFDSGLTGVIGANGSGKSTILEAIAWALYGNAAARGTRDSIRFQRAGARAVVRVELEFELGGHRYRVVRGLTSAELYLDGAESPVANSITGVTEFLQRRLGMSREEFFHTYFTGQKELDVMAALSPAERGQFLSRVLGYERLRTAQAQTRERRKTIVSEITGLKAAMRDPAVLDQEWAEVRARVEVAERAEQGAQQRAAEAERSLVVLGPAYDQEVARRDRHTAREAERRGLDVERQGLEQLIARNARDAADVATAAAELQAVAAQLAPLSSVLEEFQALEALARDDGRRRVLVDNERDAQGELARMRERLAQLAPAPALEVETAARFEVVTRTLAELDATLVAQRSTYDRDRQEAETKRIALRQQYLELQEQRERFVQLGADGICPTCARPLGESFRAVLDQLDSQIEAVEMDGKYYKARMEQLEAPPEALRTLDEQRAAAQRELQSLVAKRAKIANAIEELRTLEGTITAKAERLVALQAELAAAAAGYDPVRHAAVRQRVEQLSALERRAALLSAATERGPSIDIERRQLEERRAALVARADAMTAEAATDPFDPAAFEAARAAIDGARAEQRAAELALVTARAEARSARDARDRVAAERDAQAAARARLEALSVERRLHEELDRGYTDLRTDLNMQLRPELSELASAFLSELTDGRYGELELDDQYALVVLEDGVPKPVISGGEEDLANLVLRLAISQMIAERSGQPFSLLVLDEVFGSLDDVRRDHVLGLLRRLNDRFEQVIVITHIDSVREGLDRVLEVQLDPETGVSRVVDPEREVEGPLLAEVG